MRHTPSNPCRGRPERAAGRGMAAARPARILILAAVLAALGPRPAAAQIFHRPRCSSATCPDSVFRLEVERMTLTEGPLANDRDAGNLRELRQRILRELEATPGDAELWLALSEAELGLGDPSPAIAAAGRALEAGADSSLALRAQGAARMRMPGGEREGAATYLEALAHMSRGARPRFLADMLPMLTPEELDWWRSADLETLRRWAWDYWEHRAALAGVPPEDRLVEHMRRIATASRLYVAPGTGSGASGDGDVLRSTALRALPYDDRGLVYVRRGPPLQELRVQSDIFSELPSMTWLYAGVEGGVDAFHFAKSLNSGSGFRLVVAPACATDYAGNPRNFDAVAVAGGWVLTSAGTSSDVTRAAVSCFSGDAQTRRANAALNSIAMRREAIRALAMESPREPFDRAMPAFFDFFMFRGPDGITEVITPIVVPVGAGATQPVDMLITFADRGGGVVRRDATSSTTRANVQPSILSDGETWGVAYARTMVPPASAATFRVVLRDPADAGRGGMWGGVVSVRSFTGRGLRMSDLVVSGPGPGTFTRGSTRLFLLPGRSFAPGSNAAIFYELYDLEQGTTYRTELTLRPENESLGARVWRALTGAGEVRIRFDSPVPEDAGATLQELRSLGLPEEEGRYTLTVRVSDAHGGFAEATRSVVIARDAATPAGDVQAPPATNPTDALEGGEE